MLTRQLPFKAESKKQLSQLITSSDPPLPSSIDPTIPDELEEICLKCLSKNPQDRYSNAGKLASDLRAWLRSIERKKIQRVFISHSTTDREFAEKEIIYTLERNEIRTWYSKASIQSASEWERSILRGLESCDWFLVILSQNSVMSEWVKDELHWAVDNRPDKIIPIRIDNSELRDFHIRLARIQYVDFRQPSKESRQSLLTLF